MDFLGFLANGWCGWIAFLLFIIFAILTLVNIFNDNGLGKIVSIILGIVAILMFVEFIHGNTHRVIPLNYKAVVVDSTTGNIVGNTRNSGMIDFPFFGSSVYQFPSVTSQPICRDFTPSVKGGYEVKINVCFYADTSKMDWVGQIKKYNQYDYETLVNTWVPQIAPKVAESIKDNIPSDLTEKRAEVSTAIMKSTKEWFASENMQLNNVALTNWNFTNPEVSKAYDQTIIARTLEMKAQAELDAAKTRLEALETMSKGQATSMKELGIYGENAVVQWLYLQWLQGLDTTPIVVVGSGNNTAPIIGVNNQQLQTSEINK